ncbi:MAG: helix-turn-helix domain-containing protein [Bacteroidaceae bacterium]|nr:helix-turn-helix domain-containing protein [Bacteroidaceae bacterium]
MRKLPIVVFFFIMATALCSCMCSYRNAESRIEQDVNNALGLALAEVPCDVVSADTIRCYRNHLSIAELKETACIAMRTVGKGDTQEAEMVAEANCDFITVLKLSDQRASVSLFVAGVLWLLTSVWYVRRHREAPMVQGLCYGGIVYDNHKFTTLAGEQIRLTPMQHSLMEMFMNAEDHTLSKQEICDRLWPRKPDASDTLYTLIKRVKPVIEANTQLKIESDRGKSYSLEMR